MAAIAQVLKAKSICRSLWARPWINSERGPSDSHKLTPRQREVLGLIAQGRTMKEIASLLGISARTAESHKYEMMEALGIQSTAELVQYAMKLGLIPT